MLKWADPSDDRWHYKTNSIQNNMEIKKYINRINHDKVDWQSEMKDNYKKIQNVGNSVV